MKRTADEKRISAAHGHVRISDGSSVLQESPQPEAILPRHAPHRSQRPITGLKHTLPGPQRPLNREAVVSGSNRKTVSDSLAVQPHESPRAFDRKTSTADRSLIIDSELVPSRSTRMNSARTNETSSEFDRSVRQPSALPEIQIIPRNSHPDVEPTTTRFEKVRASAVAHKRAVDDENVVRQTAAVKSADPFAKTIAGEKFAPLPPVDAAPPTEWSRAAVEVKRMPTTQPLAAVHPVAHIGTPVEIDSPPATDSQEPARDHFGSSLLWVLLGGALVVGYVVRRRFSSPL